VTIQRITIKHSRGAYEIVECVPHQLFASLPAQTYVFTDSNVAEAIASDMPDAPTLKLPPGETNKALGAYGECLNWLAEQKAPRGATVVALGGGVIGDLAGFVAATYMRGVRLVQIPTTLLAQVDSSVGGKVGVDLAVGKNLVGAFYPPAEVRLSTELLASLSPRQFASGMAEVWKYGAIMDGELFGRLAAQTLGPSSADLAQVVRRCIRLKAQIVEEDEFERLGRRAILNFGHTIGHAIECLTGFGPVLHGEAVAIGMVAEARLGERLGLTPPGTSVRLADLLTGQKLPVRHPVLQEGESIVAALRRDKKVVDGRLAFSLLTHIGGCKLVEGVSEADVLASLEEG
jgi:3-dehydroquinate synthase